MEVAIPHTTRSHGYPCEIYMKGIVKFYDEAKRYGFITVEGDVDHFFHRTSVQEERPLQEGDRVKFNAVKGAKGMDATNIMLVKDDM